jgi:hypothetical protein
VDRKRLGTQPLTTFDDGRCSQTGTTTRRRAPWWPKCTWGGTDLGHDPPPSSRSASPPCASRPSGSTSTEASSGEHPTATETSRSRNAIGFRTGRQKTALETMDKSRTFASYVERSVRATVVSRQIGGRRETAA